jgi:small subunit ribosomal protein S8
MATHEGQKVLRLKIKYVGERRQRRAVIYWFGARQQALAAASTPRRQDIPWVLSGIGVLPFISTPKGMS